MFSLLQTSQWNALILISVIACSRARLPQVNKVILSPSRKLLYCNVLKTD